MAGLFEAFTNAFGRQFEIMAGIPTTRLTAAITRDSTTASVESTLAFPDADGAFFVGGIRFEYATATPGTMTSIEPEREFLETIPAGSLVSLDITTAPPE